MDVQGRVAPGFERVAETLAESALAAGEDGVAVAATVEGETVVDIWAGDADDGPWAEDTLCCMFSCTKGLATLCIQLLVDRGLLDVDAPVARYWPEYGAAGKQDTLVRHILTHTAGVVTFPRYWEVIGHDCIGLADHDLMARHLAAAPPSWPPGTKGMYHALSFGWLVGELVRRVDGRSLGVFFAEEVAIPQGLDLHIGLPAHLDPRVTDSRPGRHRAEPGPELAATLAEARQQLLEGDITSLVPLWLGSVFVSPHNPDHSDHVVLLMNHPAIRRAELAAGNAIGDARSLARMYSALANDGRAVNGTQLLTPAVIAQFREPQAVPNPGMAPRGLGYVLYEDAAGPDVKSGAFGHAGAGGNLGLADAERRVSYAYLKNRALPTDSAAWPPLRALYECIGD